MEVSSSQTVHPGATSEAKTLPLHLGRQGCPGQLPFQCWLGSHLIGNPLSFADISSKMEQVIENQDYETLFGLGKDIIAAFFIGGFLLAFVSTPICYFVVKNMVIQYRLNKEKRRLKKLEKRNAPDSGDLNTK